MSSTTSARLESGFMFHSEFSEIGYQRPVNKGHKNLRCFPHCRAKGHVKSGFCGAPLEFQLNPLPASANGNVERVLTWGEFASVLAPLRFSPGDLISEDTLEKEERSAKNPLNPLLRGDLDEWGESSGSQSSCTPSSPRFQFNAQMAPYHCEWSPQTPPIEGDFPCFIAHVFLQGVDSSGQVTLECLFSCRSKPFNILRRVSKPRSSKLKPKVATAAATLQYGHINANAQVNSTKLDEGKDRIDFSRIGMPGNGSKTSRKRTAAALPKTSEAATHDCVKNETEFCMSDTPSPFSPFPDWENTDDTTAFKQCGQQHSTNENKCVQSVFAPPPPPERVAMDDAKASSDPKLASKRRRGPAVATSARWWIRTIGIRMRSIVNGTAAAIQNDPLMDAETKESMLLYPNLVHFIVGHSAKEAHTNHQAEGGASQKTNRGGGGMGDSDGLEGVSGLFAEGELAAMFGSDVAMFGSDVVSFMTDETLWDSLDEDVYDGVALGIEPQINYHLTDNAPTNHTAAAAATIEPPTTSAPHTALNDNRAFQALSSFLLGEGLTEMIGEAISSIGNEFEVPEVLVAMRAMFTYNLDMWTDEREKLIHSLISSLGRRVTTVLNRKLRTRGVSHKNVMELGNQVQAQLNNSVGHVLPFLTMFARRVIREYVEDPMPHPPVPVASHLDLTGKWERSASADAGFTNEQLELTAAMNAVSLSGENHGEHLHSPHISTSVSQQFTIEHQQNAFKVQGKKWMIASHEAVILLDGVARSAIEDGGLGNNLTFALAPRLRGWHTDGSTNIVASVPINPETEVDDNDKDREGSPHLIFRFTRTGANSLSITTLVVRHHDTPSFVDEITRVYMQPCGVIDTFALSALPGCSLVTSVTEEYSRVLM